MGIFDLQVHVPLVYAGLWWKRANKHGAIAGLLMGLVVLYITTFVVPSPLGITGGIWGLLACIVGLVAGSLATEPTRQEVLEQFALGDNQKESFIEDRNAKPLEA